ncbi:Zinc finger, C3HC-like protein, partial [Metarhizium hybridum]
MNATKRKFKDLLQGLSSPGPTSPDKEADKMSSSPRYGTGTASNDTILQKRRRLGFPESMAPTLYSPSHTTTFSNVVLRKSSSQLNSKATSHSPAKYCPGDRDELLKRLATFQEITDWTPKPDKVNEIEWAKRGWICQGKEKVRCVLCHKELVVKLNRKEEEGKEVPVLVSSEIAEALVDKYSDLIVSSHQQDCLWRKRGCEDSLIRLSFSNASTTLAQLRQRYDELCARSPFLPYEFNLRLPDEVDIDNVLSQLPPDFFSEPLPVVDKSGTVATDKPPNRAALALALMGWQGLTNSRIGPVPNSASCHTCLRRLGLWMFKSKEVDEGGQVVVPAPMDHLDPLREHRFFCPWKNPQAQSRGGVMSNGKDSLTGWRTLVQTIKNESDLRNLYSGKSKRTGQLQEQRLASPSPVRGIPGTPGSPSPITPGPKINIDASSTGTPQTNAGDDEEKTREAKDKERWARLRKVKSLFDTKGSRKFRRELGRPGTGHSNKSTTGT